ncbi:MAG: valine--tRNA ligase, partial [bacterium]|nr:valine--tRNA ligase [bacterium]
AVESRWYQIWEDAGVFKPEINPDGEPFSIVIPPPNVTGVLHIGHALNMSIQDVIIRRKRMQGYAALWLPGTDHAGIATQNVVERDLAQEGLSRHDLGRERFVEQVWAWKAKHGNRITQQIRRLGFSTDWSRERFTLDDGLSDAVGRVFVELYNQGLIYRGERIINWCPRCHTALSEIEVEHEDEVGELTHIRYDFTDGTGSVVVATTRPETMLGDTAVAVHPDDERYRDVIGKTVTLPLIGREIPIVADEGVELEFGTGAVKVTPAHDPLDFEISQRHGLPAIKVIDTEANITEAGGDYFGQDRFEAREAVRHEMNKQGYIVEVEDHHHSVGHCSRCGTVVEPMLSLQWFVKVGPMIEPSVSPIKDDRARFIPKRWENNYFRWMENLRDWCISRQLWWGHRIPAWYCDACGETIVTVEEPDSCTKCGHGVLRQEQDVLDTWFSSQLWPFSTMGWPEESADLAKFYPTDVLVTAYDIIYFWVARMIMMGVHFTDAEPFEDIVIHGLVRAADGRKMSKSTGNTIDPFDIADEYGADALRLALLQSAAPGHDIPLNIEWIDAARRFGNKIWNAVRFSLNHVEGGSVPESGGYADAPGPVDAWILSRLDATIAEYDRLLDEYRFSDAVGLLYSFAWSEVFDWYLEMAKTLLRDEAAAATTKQTLGVVMRDLLALFHPVIPYVTEELWSELVGSGLVAASSWPVATGATSPVGMDELQTLIVSIRRFRAEHGISPKREIEAFIDDPDGIAADWWRQQLAAMVNVKATYEGAPAAVSGHTRMTAGSLQVFIPLDGLVDVEAERPRLEKAIAETEKAMERSQGKLANPNFAERAPADVVEAERERVAAASAKLEKLRTQLAELS